MISNSYNQINLRLSYNKNYVPQSSKSFCLFCKCLFLFKGGWSALIKRLSIKVSHCFCSLVWKNCQNQMNDYKMNDALYKTLLSRIGSLTYSWNCVCWNIIYSVNFSLLIKEMSNKETDLNTEYYLRSLIDH